MKKTTIILSLLGALGISNAEAVSFSSIVSNPFAFCSGPKPCKKCQPLRSEYERICDDGKMKGPEQQLIQQVMDEGKKAGVTLPGQNSNNSNSTANNNSILPSSSSVTLPGLVIPTNDGPKSVTINNSNGSISVDTSSAQKAITGPNPANLVGNSPNQSSNSNSSNSSSQNENSNSVTLPGLLVPTSNGPKSVTVNNSNGSYSIDTSSAQKAITAPNPANLVGNSPNQSSSTSRSSGSSSSGSSLNLLK